MYQTGDGVVHLDEVKTSANVEASKLEHNPEQLNRMLDWRDAAPGRQVGVRIDTDEGWTGLFSQVDKASGEMAIERLANADVPVSVGGRTLSPSQLDSLRQAVERAAVDPRHPLKGRRPAEWFDEHLPNLDAAREFLRPYGVDFL